MLHCFRKYFCNKMFTRAFQHISFCIYLISSQCIILINVSTKEFPLVNNVFSSYAIAFERSQRQNNSFHTIKCVWVKTLLLKATMFKSIICVNLNNMVNHYSSMQLKKKVKLRTTDILYLLLVHTFSYQFAASSWMPILCATLLYGLFKLMIARCSTGLLCFEHCGKTKNEYSSASKRAIEQHSWHCEWLLWNCRYRH